MKIFRSALLWASQSPRMEKMVRGSRAMRPVVMKFMPGETLEETMVAVRRLKGEGTPTIMTYLGENVNTDAAADQTVGEYERLFAALKAEGADAHVSIKLTQFGWDVDQGKALERVRRMIKLARENKTVLAIDMESSKYVDSTVAAYETLARESDNAALCVQAYLHRTQADIQRLIKLKPFIRLVKGAYREPADVALGKRPDVDARYKLLARELLGAAAQNVRVVFGTHDMDIIAHIRRDAKVLGVAESAFEIQMLYGIQDAGRRKLAAEGMRTRVLISYGRAWYPWFMRRLAEKPANLWMVAQNLFS
ncbi:MAG TPA: proline dehydrogenase family protein [Gemmatimonadaceae bacterium]